MSEQTAASGTGSAEHVVIQGTVISELQENLKASKFSEECVVAITSLSTGLLELADEVVAKNDLKPEIRGIHLTRKVDGSPFFAITVELAETVQPEDVTTITDRIQTRLDAARTPQVKSKKLRAIDMTSDVEHTSE